MQTPRRCGACRRHQHVWGKTTWEPAQQLYGRWVRLYRRICVCRRCFPACTGHQAMVDPDARPHIARDFFVPEDQWPTDFLEPVGVKETDVQNASSALVRRGETPDSGAQQVELADKPLTPEQEKLKAAFAAQQDGMGLGGPDRDGDFLRQLLRSLKRWEPKGKPSSSGRSDGDERSDPPASS